MEGDAFSIERVTRIGNTCLGRDDEGQAGWRLPLEEVRAMGDSQQAIIRREGVAI